MNGIQLKECRKAKGMSQATLSRLLGVTQQAVGKWETGRSNPDPEMLVRLAEVLGTTQQVYSRYENGINEMPVRHLRRLCEFYQVSADYVLGLPPYPHQKR